LLGYLIFVLIDLDSHIRIMGLLKAAMVGRVAAKSARRQMEGMQKQAQAQHAAQAQQAPQAQTLAKILCKN
jgi:hypothetical protein